MFQNTSNQQTPESLLKTSILMTRSIKEIIAALQTYPFIMKNKDGATFTPDDLIKKLTENSQSPLNMLNSPMIDDTYGLRSKLAAISRPEPLERTASLRQQQTTAPQSPRRAALFSPRGNPPSAEPPQKEAVRPRDRVQQAVSKAKEQPVQPENRNRNKNR